MTLVPGMVGGKAGERKQPIPSFQNHLQTCSETCQLVDNQGSHWPLLNFPRWFKVLGSFVCLCCGWPGCLCLLAPGYFSQFVSHPVSLACLASEERVWRGLLDWFEHFFFFSLDGWGSRIWRGFIFLLFLLFWDYPTKNLFSCCFLF